jgi:sugar (pentulose or hexulose) kinase
LTGTAPCCGPAILWNDQRTGLQCAEITERVGGLKRLLELTGNAVLPGFTAPKIVWLGENEPEIYAQVEHVLLPKDYIRYQLTGEYATEVSDASGTSPRANRPRLRPLRSARRYTVVSRIVWQRSGHFRPE